MAEVLRDRRILVVEDEYMIAMAMQHGLEELGAQIVGPVASVDEALALLKTTLVDGAILDVKLVDEEVFPVAEALSTRGIPFLFATGYNVSDLPPGWQHVPRFEKPVEAATAARALFGA